jgi:hypothetical protein
MPKFCVTCIILLSAVAFSKTLPPAKHSSTPSICDSVPGNMVTNCGFENGDFVPGWTPIPAASGSFFGVDSSNPNSGTYGAYFGGNTVGSYDAIQQTIKTIPGQPYKLSFSINTDASTRDFQAYWNGVLIYDNSATGTDTYTQISLTVVGTGSDSLMFQDYNPIFFDYLDDVILLPIRTDAFQVRYFANLSSGPSAINITNSGAIGGFDPGGDICADVYVFAEDQQLIACCTCPLTPNHLKTLSVQNDLISNTLTPGVPIGVTVALLATKPVAGKCNAAAPVVSTGMRAWGTTLHAAPGGGFFGTETEFSQGSLSLSEYNKLTSYCGFIQADGSSFGICGSCRQGAAGANRQ